MSPTAELDNTTATKQFLFTCNSSAELTDLVFAIYVNEGHYLITFLTLYHRLVKVDAQKYVENLTEKEQQKIGSGSLTEAAEDERY